MRVLRDHPAFQSCYDPAPVTEPRHIVQGLQRYDRQVFVRWNRVSGRFEIWRWYGLVIPSRPELVPPAEMVRRAGFCFSAEGADKTYRPLDSRLLRGLYLGDVMRRFGSFRAYARYLEQQDRLQYEAQMKTISDVTLAFSQDHVRQLAEAVGRPMPLIWMGGRGDLRKAKA